MKKVVWFSILLFRIICGIFNKSWYHPDEYYQSLEVAHQKIYGSGFKTWEWETELRSSAHVVIFCFIYKLLNFLHLDNNHCLFVYSPKVLCGFFGFILDYATFKYASVEYGINIGFFTLFCSVTCFFNAYVGVRSFANSLEATLTALGLWFWANFEKSSYEIQKQVFISKTKKEKTISNTDWNLVWFVFAALGACIIRPTNLLLWLPRFLLFLIDRRSSHPFGIKSLWRRFILIFHLGFRTYIIISLSVITLISINTVCDYYVYGHLTFPIFKFFTFNLFSGNSSLFSTSPVYFYVVLALPFMLNGFILLFPFGLVSNNNFRDLFSVIFVLLPYSLLPHKEVRFVYPLISLFITGAGRGLMLMKNVRWRWMLLVILTVLHCGVLIVFTRYFHGAEVSVTADIRDYAMKGKSGVVFMATYDIPWQSHIHFSPLDDNWRFIRSSAVDAFLPTANRELWTTEQLLNGVWGRWEGAKTGHDLNKIHICGWPDVIVLYEKDVDVVKKSWEDDKLLYREVKRYNNEILSWWDSGYMVVIYERLNVNT